MNTYQTITGRSLDLSGLSEVERAFLGRIRKQYEEHSDWNAFASWWPQELTTAGLTSKSVLYRVCQDLEARLGIAQGKVALPDYRDYLLDLIEERYGSRYRFCKETGLDPGHLSRVFASRSDLSLAALQRVLAALGASLVIQSVESLSGQSSPEIASASLAQVGLAGA